MKKEIDCFNIIEANLETIKKGKPLPYTKEQFSKSKYGINSLSMFDWNLNLPNAEQFTKLEHSEGRHCTATAILHWNIDLPNAEQYTKHEHATAEDCDKFEKQGWNEYLPNAEQYTDKEINEL